MTRWFLFFVFVFLFFVCWLFVFYHEFAHVVVFDGYGVGSSVRWSFFGASTVPSEGDLSSLSGGELLSLVEGQNFVDVVGYHCVLVVFLLSLLVVVGFGRWWFS